MRTEYHGPTPDVTPSSIAASCTVEDVKTEASWGIVSRIACSGTKNLFPDDPLHGFWMATSVGLFHLDEAPTHALPLTRATLVLRASPKPDKVEFTDGTTGGKYETMVKGAGFCRSISSYGGDEGWSEVCIEPGKGFVSGKWGWSGGSTVENEFTSKLEKP
jgi:hypothetical protein